MKLAVSVIIACRTMVDLRVTAFVVILAAFGAQARPASDSAIKWVLHHGSESPPENAIVAGFVIDNHGKDIPHYVGRVWATSIGAIIPACVTLWEAYWAFAFLRGQRYSVVPTFEVAVLDPSSSASVQWVPSAGGVPEGAVPVGITSDKETLYSCRVLDLELNEPNTSAIQKMMPGALADGKCYINVDGGKAYSKYEVLVLSRD